MKLKRVLRDGERGGDVLAVQRALNAAPSKTVIEVTKLYDETTQRRVKAFRKANGLLAGTTFEQSTLNELEPYFDAYGKARYRLFRPPPPKPEIPELGPIIDGGKSVLLHDCTHLTSGLEWPAFDDAKFFDKRDVGRAVLAPEDCVVDDNTSGAAGGDAFYITGASGLRYWVGHISTVPKLGAKFKKGATMTEISSEHSRPHVHLGIDARPLIGHHLISHDDYTHGAPTVGAQLEAALL